ncbi:alpha/beta fold hydrolase [Streptomyces sp. NRRL B-1347]|uniref:alpha/beta fold hydrolase n=1 Tax=Streptomyces sp. NRRL B-1347 TaxID=1476877 RepID=UPI000AE881FF|nr:alpha/beta fold hydrolase [Streptomyces sp. NRRL B-1347]
MTYKSTARRAGLAVGMMAVVASVLPTATTTATAAAPVSGPAAAAAPGWCPGVPGHQVDCDREERPLVTGKPKLGTVKVSYAVVRHRAPGPAKGTVALNPGGPGETLIDKAKEVTWALEGLLKDHDVLLVDPRGTGKSQRVPCGVTDAEYRLGTRVQQRAAVERCGKNLGPKAAGFTSAATADDIDAIRARLKVRKLSLYGLSYGTYLMPVYASRHPENVRNIVLSGAYPLALDTMARPSAQAVSTTLRRICERSVPVACDGERAVKDLATTAARLRTKPLTIPITTDHGVYKKKFTEDKLANLLFEAASSQVGFQPDQPSLLGQLPYALHRFVKGDTAPLRKLVREEGASGSKLDQAPYIAVVCNDYRRDWSKDASLSERWRQYRAALAAVRPGEHGAFSAKGFTEGTTDAGEVCIGWPGKNTPDAQPTKPKLPNVPVLVLSGDLDSNTPDASGKKAAKQFRDSRFLSVRNMGHVPELELSRCVTGVSSHFIRANTPGDTSCLRALPPIAVTPVRG